MTVTNDDMGKTLNVTLGTVLVLAYERSGMTWSDTYNTAILKPAASGELSAIGKGQTQVESSGRPSCSPGQVCPHFVQAFNFTVLVT